MKNSLLIILILNLICQSGHCQTGKFSVGHFGHKYFLNGEKLDVITTNEWGISGDGYAHSNYDGTFQFYAETGNLYNTAMERIVKPNLLPFNNSKIIKLTDSTFIMVSRDDSEQTSQDRINLIYSRFNSTSKGVWYIADSINLVLDAFPLNRQYSDTSPFIYGLEVIEDTSGNTWLVSRMNRDSFISYKFNASCIGCEKVFSDISGTTDIWGTCAQYGSLTRSPSGNFLAQLNNKDCENKLICQIFHFNKETGVVSFKNNLHSLIKAKLPMSKFISIDERYLSFSSNDEFVYFLLTGSSSEIPSDSLFCYRMSLSGIPNLEYLFGRSLGTKTPYVDIKLFNNGRMYMSYLNLGTKSMQFDAIVEPNNKLLSALEKEVLTVSDRAYKSIGRQFSNSKYNYIRVSPKYSYSCAADVSFGDSSDYSLGSTTIRYYSEEIAGSGKLIARGIKPTIRYEKSGNYLVKVELTSTGRTYKEIHYDTLKVRVPEKPVANFNTKDTTVCAYSSVHFSNTSSSAKYNTKGQPKWVWTFGDGSSETTYTKKDVTHVFEQAGDYTISLFFFNGYCDSTLVRNQYVHVVKSPTPGFTVDDTIGCSPHSLKLHDASSGAIVQREYYFSDIKKWLPYSSNDTNFNFTSEGNYFIVQRLTGFTGCVTQRDTIYVRIKPGLTLTDTAHISVATYLDNKMIQVSWAEIPHALSYELYRGSSKFNSTLLAQTNSTSYFDSLNVAPSLFTYSVRAIDSCGNSTSIGRIGSPILLEGEVSDDNSFATLNFSPYREWLDSSKILYDIQRLNGNWETFKSTKNLQIIDEDFLQPSQTQMCYRVIAHGAEFTSTSNILCLSYPSIVYLPTSFTPNRDGLNDQFRPYAYGFKEYTVSIYNRWGEQIVKLNPNESWDGGDYPMGLYHVYFNGRDDKNILRTKSSYVLILK